MTVDVPILEDPRHQRVLDWELTPPASREPKTKLALAAALGVSDRTIRGWTERPEFQMAWKLAFQAIAGSMERTKALLDQLYADGMDEDNKARVASAKLYWDISRAIAPPEPPAVAGRRAAELSDAELIAMLSDGAFAELMQREKATAS